MFHELRDKPSKRLAVILLLAGLAVFISAYSYIILLFSRTGIMDTTRFNQVWTSFDVYQFEMFLHPLVVTGLMKYFVLAYKINILSMAAFGCAFFGLSLLLARTVPSRSRLYGTAMFFPVLTILIALLDIIPSIMLVASAATLPLLSKLVVFCISGSYLVRALLLYVLLAWIAVTAIMALLRKLKKK